MREFAEPLLSEHTTIRLGGPALAKIVIEKVEDLEELQGRLAYWGGQPFWLGKGSNLLAHDGFLPHVLVQMGNCGISIVGIENGKTIVRAEAGAPLARLLNFCLKNGLSGLEGLAGIPGSVGGAAAMNAGSFGSETTAHIHSAILWSAAGAKRYGRDEISGSYRKTRFGNDDAGIITEIFFALTPLPNNVIFTRMCHNFFAKKSRQPLTAWSAGCAFKNPPGISAGLLLDQAGFKGKELGGMAFSRKHANFLVNTGGGSSSAACDLLALAREKVRAATGHELELEIRILK